MASSYGNIFPIIKSTVPSKILKQTHKKARLEQGKGIDKGTEKGKSHSILFRMSKNSSKVTQLQKYLANKIIPGDIFHLEPDGPYTWIIANPGKRLFLSRVDSGQEIGSLHINLKLGTQSTEILAAGELIKTGNTAVFNFQSGTFMEPKFRSKVKKAPAKPKKAVTAKTKAKASRASTRVKANVNANEDADDFDRLKHELIELAGTTFSKAKLTPVFAEDDTGKFKYAGKVLLNPKKILSPHMKNYLKTILSGSTKSYNSNSASSS
jgi:hypothetical protein